MFLNFLLKKKRKLPTCVMGIAYIRKVQNSNKETYTQRKSALLTKRLANE